MSVWLTIKRMRFISFVWCLISIASVSVCLISNCCLKLWNCEVKTWLWYWNCDITYLMSLLSFFVVCDEVMEWLWTKTQLVHLLFLCTEHVWCFVSDVASLLAYLCFGSCCLKLRLLVLTSSVDFRSVAYETSFKGMKGDCSLATPQNPLWS